MMNINPTKKRSIAIFFFFAFLKLGWAQEYQPENSSSDGSGFMWPKDIKMAISLTFDDARYSQIDSCIPLLDQYNVKGTFYVSINNLMSRIDAWREAVDNGHEVGNHTLRHSCSRNFKWARAHALEDYSIAQMEAELDSANIIIEELLGIQPVSFAYPCGQTYIGQGVDTKSYVPVVAAKFQSGRTWMDEAPNDPVFCNVHQLTGIKLDGKHFEELKPVIDLAAKDGMWLILAGHETKKTGDSDALVSSLATIEALCQYAKDPANGIWLDNVQNIASFIVNQNNAENLKVKQKTD